MKKGRVILVAADDSSDRNDVVIPLRFGGGRLLVGVGFSVFVMLAAWGCSKNVNSPAPLDHTKKTSDRNDAVVPPRSELHSERGSESVSCKVSEGSEKGSDFGAGSSTKLPAHVSEIKTALARDVVYQLGNQLQLLADEDLRAAFAAAYRESPGPVREELLGRFAFIFAKSMPAEAAAIVEKDMAAGSEHDEAAIAVVHQWALNDLVGAQAWVKTFPEGALKARAFREIAGVTDYVEATLRQRTDG